MLSSHHPICNATVPSKFSSDEIKGNESIRSFALQIQAQVSASFEMTPDKLATLFVLPGHIHFLPWPWRCHRILLHGKLRSKGRP